MKRASSRFSRQIKIWGPFLIYLIFCFGFSHIFGFKGRQRDRHDNFINAHIVRFHSFNLLLSIKSCLLYSIRFYSNIWSTVINGCSFSSKIYIFWIILSCFTSNPFLKMFFVGLFLVCHRWYIKQWKGRE